MTIDPPSRWAGLFESERSYRTLDLECVAVLRERLRYDLTDPGACFIDPGVNGCVVVGGVRVGPSSIFPLWHEGAIVEVAAAARKRRVRLIVCESQYINPKQPNAIDIARQGGIIVAGIAAKLARPPHVVWTPPAAWQSMLSLPERAKRKERKAAAVKAAEQSALGPLLVDLTKEQKEGVADAWGIMTWFQLGTLGASPIRR